jgi:hypothetical protein
MLFCDKVNDKRIMVIVARLLLLEGALLVALCSLLTKLPCGGKKRREAENLYKPIYGSNVK